MIHDPHVCSPAAPVRPGNPLALRSDEQLIHEYIADRSAAAFEQLVLRYERQVYRVCYQRLKNNADALDAAQEVFLKLSLGAAEIHGRLGGWLHRCAVNTAVSMIRTDSARRRREAGVACTDRAQDATDDQQDMHALIRQCLSQLEQLDRVIIEQTILGDRTQAQVAKEHGISQQAVAKRRARAMRWLRQTLSERGLVGTLALVFTGIVRRTAVAEWVGLLSTPGGTACKVAAVVLLAGVLVSPHGQTHSPSDDAMDESAAADRQSTDAAARSNHEAMNFIAVPAWYYSGTRGPSNMTTRPRSLGSDAGLFGAEGVLTNVGAPNETVAPPTTNVAAMIAAGSNPSAVNPPAGNEPGRTIAAASEETERGHAPAARHRARSEETNASPITESHEAIVAHGDASDAAAAHDDDDATDAYHPIFGFAGGFTTDLPLHGFFPVRFENLEGNWGHDGPRWIREDGGDRGGFGLPLPIVTGATHDIPVIVDANDDDTEGDATDLPGSWGGFGHVIANRGGGESPIGVSVAVIGDRTNPFVGSVGGPFHEPAFNPVTNPVAVLIGDEAEPWTWADEAQWIALLGNVPHLSLNLTSAPEPSCGLLMGLTGAMLVLRRRR
ncbi:MAG: sigma-70 family RNA polymerase sigma factor [Planctomycetes bacterium]|nr:sigma-70 family RNA polymerase sigma factor [Planctomycetota bacterium]